MAVEEINEELFYDRITKEFIPFYERLFQVASLVYSRALALNSTIPDRPNLCYLNTLRDELMYTNDTFYYYKSRIDTLLVEYQEKVQQKQAEEVLQENILQKIEEQKTIFANRHKMVSEELQSYTNEISLIISIVSGILLKKSLLRNQINTKLHEKSQIFKNHEQELMKIQDNYSMRSSKTKQMHRKFLALDIIRCNAEKKYKETCASNAKLIEIVEEKTKEEKEICCKNFELGVSFKFLQESIEEKEKIANKRKIEFESACRSIGNLSVAFEFNKQDRIKEGIYVNESLLRSLDVESESLTKKNYESNENNFNGKNLMICKFFHLWEGFQRWIYYKVYAKCQKNTREKYTIMTDKVIQETDLNIMEKKNKYLQMIVKNDDRKSEPISREKNIRESCENSKAKKKTRARKETIEKFNVKSDEKVEIGEDSKDDSIFGIFDLAKGNSKGKSTYNKKSKL